MPDTELHDAVIDGNINDTSVITNILNKNPQIIDAQDEDGRTALHYTTQYGYEKRARMLIQYGAKIDIEDKYGSNAIGYATTQGMAELVVEMFSLVKIDINKQYGKEKETLLHDASICGQHELVKFFLSKGADKTIKNARNETPADIARRNIRESVALPELRQHYANTESLIKKEGKYISIRNPVVNFGSQPAWEVLNYLERKIRRAERDAEVLKILDPFGLEPSSTPFWKNKTLLIASTVVGVTAVVATAAVASDLVDVPPVCKII